MRSNISRSVRYLCNRAFFIDRGRMVSYGEPEKVIGEYMTYTRKKILEGDELALKNLMVKPDQYIAE